MRIADLTDDTPTEQDASATWLLGHTERITMGRLYARDGELRVDAVIHVPCRYLRTEDGSAPAVSAAWRNGTRPPASVRCAVHGFRGPVPIAPPRAAENLPRRLPDGRLRVVFRRRERVGHFPLRRAARRSLPVLQEANPCVGAPCETADHTRGAACCRDLTLDVIATLADEDLEALLRARQSPYLCKVARTNETTIECEVISACAYLEDDGVGCVLHDRLLPNGRGAKPFMCVQWPELGPDEVGHPGCRLLEGNGES